MKTAQKRPVTRRSVPVGIFSLVIAVMLAVLSVVWIRYGNFPLYLIPIGLTLLEVAIGVVMLWPVGAPGDSLPDHSDEGEQRLEPEPTGEFGLTGPAEPGETGTMPSAAGDQPQEMALSDHAPGAPIPVSSHAAPEDLDTETGDDRTPPCRARRVAPEDDEPEVPPDPQGHFVGATRGIEA